MWIKNRCDWYIKGPQIYATNGQLYKYAGLHFLLDISYSEESLTHVLISEDIMIILMKEISYLYSHCGKSTFGQNHGFWSRILNKHTWSSFVSWAPPPPKKKVDLLQFDRMMCHEMYVEVIPRSSEVI